MRVLIVEDNTLVGMLVEEQLREHGDEILGLVSSAAAARKTIAKTVPDLMFVDIQLADGDTGRDFAHETREHLNVPTIFITGSPEKARECTDALGVLVKPFSADLH